MAKYTYGIWLISLWVLQGALRTTGETPPPPAYSVDPPSYNEGKALPSYDEALSDSIYRHFSSGVSYAGSEVANDDEVGLLEYGDQYAFPVDTLNLPDVLAPVIELLRLPQVISLDRNNRTAKAEELIVESKKVFGLYLSRIPGSEIHISLRKLLQTGPLDKLAQLIYSFDSKYYIPNQVSGSNSEVGSPVIITQSIVKIPNLTNDQDRLRFLSPLLVYEGRSGLALDIAHARRQSPTDGSKLSTMEALKISEVTGFMILSDCLRAAILVNDVSAVGGFLLVDMTYKEDSQAGRDLGLFTWDDLELLGFFLMALRWKRYAAAGQLRIAVIPEIPGETVASSIAKRALDWFDRQGYQNPLDPLDFDDLLAPFPNYLLGQPDDYIFTKESQPKDLYYTVIDPTAFTRESALQKYRKLVNEPAPAPWAKPVSRLNNRSHSVSTSPTGRSARHSPALASPTWLRNRTNLTPIILDPATMDPSSSISTTTSPALPAVTQSEQPQWLIDLQLAKAARAQATQVSSSSNEPNPDSERVEPPRPANLPNPTSGSVRSRIQQWSNMAPS